jgi:hypothetical protein
MALILFLPIALDEIKALFGALHYFLELTPCAED